MLLRGRIQEAYAAAIEESKSKLVVIHFWAEWSGPCKARAPVVHELYENFQGKVGFYKIDVDEFEQATAANAVRSVPTTVFFRDGVKTGVVMGANSSELKDAILKNLA